MEKQQSENPTLKEKVPTNTELKKWLVNYVGEKTNPDNGEVTVEAIVNVIAEEFPEFLMAVAEENFIRGYQQAMADIQFSPEFIKGKKINKRKK